MALYKKLSPEAIQKLIEQNNFQTFTRLPEKLLTQQILFDLYDGPDAEFIRNHFKILHSIPAKFFEDSEFMKKLYKIHGGSISSFLNHFYQYDLHCSCKKFNFGQMLPYQVAVNLLKEVGKIDADTLTKLPIEYHTQELLEICHSPNKYIMNETIHHIYEEEIHQQNMVLIRELLIDGINGTELGTVK